MDALRSEPSLSFSPPDMQAALVDVDIKEELSQRLSRDPDYEAEHKALLQLAQAMTEHPADVLQKLIDITCEVCRADTAGLSLLETHNGEELFRWKPSRAGMLRIATIRCRETPVPAERRLTATLRN
jgi:hypothetical protein